eukprot:3296838-Pyramimonas_sp.AAC.1
MEAVDPPRGGQNPNTLRGHDAGGGNGVVLSAIRNLGARLVWPRRVPQDPHQHPHRQPRA